MASANAAEEGVTVDNDQQGYCMPMQNGMTDEKSNLVCA